MARPSNSPAVLTPPDIQALSQAFESTLSSISEGPFDHLPPRTLRRAVASRIIAEAARGERDPARLKEAALAALSERPEPGAPTVT